jgi:hypothetical protein
MRFKANAKFIDPLCCFDFHGVTYVISKHRSSNYTIIQRGSDVKMLQLPDYGWLTYDHILGRLILKRRDRLYEMPIDFLEKLWSRNISKTDSNFPFPVNYLYLCSWDMPLGSSVWGIQSKYLLQMPSNDIVTISPICMPNVTIFKQHILLESPAKFIPFILFPSKYFVHQVKNGNNGFALIFFPIPVILLFSLLLLRNRFLNSLKKLCPAKKNKDFVSLEDYQINVNLT